MSIPLAQNFFKESVTTEWTSGAGNFYISTKPINDIGYLVLSPASASLREIVKFTAVGTDGGGDYVTLTAANRGLGGTTDQSHAVGEDVYMNVVAEHLQDISDALDQIVAAGAQYADENQIGIVKMNTAPSESMGTVTLTVATPAVFTFASHALDVNDIVKITTDGSLPTGITANTKYYVISDGLTTNTFQLSSTLGGTALNTSGSQSGTHTLLDVTPKAVGPNDPALPSVDQAAALAGTSGTPSATNKFVTDEDTDNTGVTDKIIRANGTDLPDGITKVCKKAYSSGDTADLVISSTSEQTIFTQEIAADLMGTNNVLRLKFYLSDFTIATGAGNLTLRLKYGSTTLSTIVFPTTGTTRVLKGYLEAILTANNSASAQTSFLELSVFEDYLTASSIGSATTFMIHGAAGGTSTEDSTTALDFVVTAQYSGGTTNHNIKPSGIVMELLT